MGFSYVVAVAVLLSSSLIFFGMVYSDFVHSEAQLNNAQNEHSINTYDYINSKVLITGYNSTPATGSNYTVSVNLSNTGSVTMNLAKSNLLVNGSIVNFTYASQYLFPLGNDSVEFTTGAGSYNIEIVFNTGYEQFGKVTV